MNYTVFHEFRPIQSQQISADVVKTRLTGVISKFDHCKKLSNTKLSCVFLKSCKYHSALGKVGILSTPLVQTAFNCERKLLNESNVINHSLNMTIDHTTLQKADSRVTLSGW